jgi:hypothetical protein
MRGSDDLKIKCKKKKKIHFKWVPKIGPEKGKPKKSANTQ